MITAGSTPCAVLTVGTVEQLRQFGLESALVCRSIRPAYLLGGVTQRTDCYTGGRNDTDGGGIGFAKLVRIDVDLDQLGAGGWNRITQCGQLVQPRADREHHVGRGHSVFDQLRCAKRKRPQRERMIGWEGIEPSERGCNRHSGKLGESDQRFDRPGAQTPPPAMMTGCFAVHKRSMTWRATAALTAVCTGAVMGRFGSETSSSRMSPRSTIPTGPGRPLTLSR